ncbi:hypothetical protein H5410_035938 [Solanum commersonii]|uniref:Uncharacterized protein n=1 Tax=Solanum commersonii TaxID=4109 RepID=A0A9J5Y402_SOLCO|nr:hypothetical protein H5410_035938 [Solanum commersonii]
MSAFISFTLYQYDRICDIYTKAGHRTGTGRFDRVVDRYRDEPDRNNRDGGLVPSRPTIYRDGPKWNGMG